jgi:septum site-determining protein MinC
MRLKGRSFMAFILAPEPPLAHWLAGLDDHLARGSVFANRPVIVDVQRLAPDEPGLEALLEDLNGRGVRVVDVEGGALPGFAHAGVLSGGRDVPDAPFAEDPAPVCVPPPLPEPSSLIVDAPIRSGQSVRFPSGDVTVLGSVASGAEVLAGGSIHVYGALRGRAIAGALGQRDARIFCDRMEAELVSIDGLYRTAEMIDSGLRGKRVQVRMDGDSLVVSALR